MNKNSSSFNVCLLVMATVFAGLIAACGSGDDGRIFGVPVATTGAGAGPAGPAPALGVAAGFAGLAGGGAGMTNQGILTVISGAQGQPVSIGTTAASTTVTGFHDLSVPYTSPSPGPASGCTYTETPLNIGEVNGTIITDAPPPTISCPAEGTLATKALADQAALDTLAAFNDLAARPGAVDPGANLGGLTLAPGVYAHSAGTFLITGSDLTLDAGGNADAVWVFQMATSLTVGAAGLPRSIILAGGAQPKNIFWQVGSSATINAAGGGTMVGTIISSAGTSISTAGNLTITTLNGRALALTASVTIVNTVINVPAP